LYPLFGVLLNSVLAAAAMAMSSVSVVTNALRLRSFRRPANAAAILHPPRGERVGEYAYLAGIAVVALGVGAAAIGLAQPEHVESIEHQPTHGSESSARPAMPTPAKPARGFSSPRRSRSRRASRLGWSTG
ncbi:MAG: hypothetical protein HY329_05035, partial [Chloroflexi bacterium]|nr:hypothetical protein [Chloroflexota bacterium]